MLIAVHSTCTFQKDVNLFVFKEFRNPFLEKEQDLMLIDIIDDFVGKRLKQLVRIKRCTKRKGCS